MSTASVSGVIAMTCCTPQREHSTIPCDFCALMVATTLFSCPQNMQLKAVLSFGFGFFGGGLEVLRLPIRSLAFAPPALGPVCRGAPPVLRRRARAAQSRGRSPGGSRGGGPRTPRTPPPRRGAPPMAAAAPNERAVDLRPSSRPVSLKAVVLQVADGRENGDAKTAWVADPTASLRLQLVGNECAVQPGEVIQVTNGRFDFDAGDALHPVLRVTSSGTMTRLGEFAMVFAESPDMSRWEWVKTPNGSAQPATPLPTSFWRPP